VTVRDIPVDGFWSTSVCNAGRYFERYALGAYSPNNPSPKPDPDGSLTIQFGGCRKTTPNCLPLCRRLQPRGAALRPREEILAGSWKFPDAQPAKRKGLSR
jgi:hypothetical protein